MRTSKSLNPGINRSAALLTPGMLAPIKIMCLEEEQGGFHKGTQTSWPKSRENEREGKRERETTSGAAEP